MKFSMRVEGLRALDMQLKELGHELGEKTLVSAARKAFAPVAEEARARAPVDTGNLRDSIRVRVVKPKRGSEVVLVGLRIAKVVRSGASSRHRRVPRKTDSADWRWHWVEFGRSGWSKGSRRAGPVAARPFIRPAFDRYAAEMPEVLKREIAKAIARALKRKGRK